MNSLENNGNVVTKFVDELKLELSRMIELRQTLTKVSNSESYIKNVSDKFYAITGNLALFTNIFKREVYSSPTLPDELKAFVNDVIECVRSSSMKEYICNVSELMKIINGMDKSERNRCQKNILFIDDIVADEFFSTTYKTVCEITCVVGILLDYIVDNVDIIIECMKK